jgi:ribonucleoside-diphosphate reductase alpha chain
MKPANHYPPYLQASNIGKATVGVQKETRGSMATTTKQYTEAEKNACSLDAMLNGGTCEACQ